MTDAELNAELGRLVPMEAISYHMRMAARYIDRCRDLGRFSLNPLEFYGHLYSERSGQIPADIFWCSDFWVAVAEASAVESVNGPALVSEIWRGATSCVDILRRFG